MTLRIERKPNDLQSPHGNFEIEKLKFPVAICNIQTVREKLTLPELLAV